MSAKASMSILGALGADGVARAPLGEAALVAPDSVSWRAFKNPVSLFIGGAAGGFLDHRIGPKRAVQVEVLMSLVGIIALLGMSPTRILYVWAYDPATAAPVWNGPFFTTWPDIVFLLIGFSNAIFITAHYASSRTLLTRLTPPEMTGTFFGVYALSGTATLWLGSLLVNLGTNIFKTQQGGFATIAVLLAVGFVGTLFVKGGNRGEVAS